MGHLSEVYNQQVFDAPFASIASQPEMARRTLVVDGHSKAFAMTGWRLGYGLGPVELVDAIARLVNNSVSCTAAFTQDAGLTALESARDHSKVFCARTEGPPGSHGQRAQCAARLHLPVPGRRVLRLRQRHRGLPAVGFARRRGAAGRLAARSGRGGAGPGLFRRAAGRRDGAVSAVQLRRDEATIDEGLRRLRAFLGG